MTAFENNLALGTSCLGLHPSHYLDVKLRAAANHGFTGIEIVYGDLERFSDRHKLSMTAAADRIRQLCDNSGLHILSLCPFENFEGSQAPLEERLEVAKSWMNIARILKAKHIQVPAQFDRSASTDESVIVSELQQLADLGLAVEPIVAIAYEPMGWSIRYSTWESALQLSNLVDRPNFGLCLDSFHEASKHWGNPADPSGKQPRADQNLADSLQRFEKEFPIEKLFYVQLSDGERFDPLYSKSHPWYLEGEDPLFTWSKHARPFPLESEIGGCMPVVEIVRTWLVNKGFNGWISLETFDRRMRDSTFKPEDGASRAVRSIKRLQKATGGGDPRL